MIYSWKKIIKNSIPILTIAVLVEIFAGSILQGNYNLIIIFPIFLISIPVINSVGGNIGSVLGARLASGLHVGYVKANLKDKRMQENLFTAIILGLITYTILAIIIYYGAVFANLSNNMNIITFVLIFVLTGFLLICTVAISSILSAFISFKRGYDPDDMIAPVVTTVGDFMGILFLILMTNIFGVGI